MGYLQLKKKTLGNFFLFKTALQILGFPKALENSFFYLDSAVLFCILI